jgi:hypothetical protein
MALVKIPMREIDDMTLPVFPNGYARQTVCACDPKMIIPARTMIDGKWRLVCMTCGSLNFMEIKQ